ncbi:hypothetical protein A3H10_02160 [Candidatus Uhrbacteria bacterium RIFCSPLOWO2_12_FULL_46_10]|uniref:Ribulose-phosphate 3-epimerase n=1 Tax=Candidatus Uhrbacteria bacterium RIFCSPLOWO2_01_FULL_47_25 TaxID=1802402 RepID=A0A1F7UW64_9BACT|nr:MAG: Ribulose-phosphate 3-epimerase [Parcubacteria group bacterium GW2011_GWA2_46_9]OGL59671.1 MAG: hypothetical protein A2752_05010 [Candidatus Uhrbacteria bacterium RIFCSPHIGHO2_01_FULL_46_23]OGL68038.1 MAG: hypothetical protein A3D60_02790 [Candidatus Uhrbacteria bacterium RIFCSPHIGHO2_02_FULL_47_29]OGL76215.1 MAG: hypothetical protein A3E96_03835 [Candidatus Uhrbacteria bacterium RIFCSPHIGHO2_12_FULL_46_13]OGL82520.1 MAG: hypothetical protein A2936_03820 [Candidatus Uhrbacteria bacterium
MEIIPSILTNSKDELASRLELIRDLDMTIQLDFMDGQFVVSRSLLPAELPKELARLSWEAHLMVQNPIVWSQTLYLLGVKRVYWHVEALSSEMVIPHHLSHIEHGLALRLETPIVALEPFITMIQSVLLLSITNPGYQGEPFQESVYDKIKELKRNHPHIKVMVDGGVNLEHLKILEKLGVDRVAVGSSFWKFGDPRTVLAAFRQATL